MSDGGRKCEGRLTGIVGRKNAAEGFLAGGYAQFDVVLSSWHQTEDDNNSLVGFLVHPQ